MHTLAVQLAPILGAEKSKAPFYIAGGLLVAWALLLSLGIGMRRSDFPSNLAQQRGVMAISAVLVLAAVSTAVITSGGASKSEASSATPTTKESGGVTETSTATATAPTKPTTTTKPTATTGAPTSPATTKPTAKTKPTATTGAPTSPATSLKLAANPEGQLSYDTKTLSAKAGSVTITMTNSSPVEHNVTIAQGSTILGATPTFTGSSKTLALKLTPGTYEFYCSVPGHRQAGMEGKLTVS
jgi:uncharacterized cupredoxin-like copper-binding protein